MKSKVIELIKDYRVESERLWNPQQGYIGNHPEVSQGKSIVYNKCADDLEKLLKSWPSEQRHVLKFCPDCDRPWDECDCEDVSK